MAQPFQITNPNVLGNLQAGLQIGEGFRQAGRDREVAGLKLQGTRDTARINSVVQGAQQLKLISDPQQKLAFLKDRREKLAQSKIPTQDTDKMISLLEAGDLESVESETDKAIAFGKQIIKGDFSKGVQLTGKRNGQDVLLTSSFNKSTGQVALVETVISSKQAQAVKTAQNNVMDVGEIGNTSKEQVVRSVQGGGIQTQLSPQGDGFSLTHPGTPIAPPSTLTSGEVTRKENEAFASLIPSMTLPPTDGIQQVVQPPTDVGFQFTNKNTGLTPQEESDLVVEESRKKERAKLEEKFALSPDIAGAVKTAEREAEADTQGKVVFSKEKAKWRTGRANIKGKIATADRKQNVIKVTGEKIKNLMTKWNTGFGSSLKLLPAAEARTLASLIDTMRANTAFATLREIKDTGGTLGAVSAPELKLLESAYGQIDQAGEIPEQIRVIDQIMDATQGSVDQMRKGFKENEELFSGSFEDADRLFQDSRDKDDIDAKKKRLEELRAKQRSAQ